MKMIVCIDDRGGLMFGCRRQSQDRILRERILKIVEGNGARLIMSPYSARQFGEHASIVISNTPLANASNQDFYFLEDLDYSKELCDEILIFRWNRHYPSDKQFVFNSEKDGFSLFHTEDFEGSSHKKITQEHYKKL